MSDRTPDPRDRPAGLAPKGSSAGLGIVMLYWLAAPAITCFGLIPFGRTFFDWFVPALAGPVVGIAVMLPIIVGFKSRRYWGVCLFYWSSIAAIGLVLLSLLIIAAALAITWHAPPSLISLTWEAGGCALVLALFLPFPLRALRLRYWQPGAARSEWEIGDERINPRVVRALGGRR